MYITSHTVIEDRCTGMAIRDLCSIRDGIDHLPFVSNYKAVIESMCINLLTVVFVICTFLLCFVYRFNSCFYFVPLHMSTYNKDIIIIISSIIIIIRSSNLIASYPLDTNSVLIQKMFVQIFFLHKFAPYSVNFYVIFNRVLQKVDHFNRFI